MRWSLLAAVLGCAALFAGLVAATARPGNAPTGTIVYASESADGWPHIDIAHVDGTGVKQLTWYTGDAHKPHVTASDSQPAISPDGTKVAFDRQSIYCRPDTTPACRPVKASANSPWAPGLRILDLSTRKMIKVNDSSILQYQWLGMRWTADSKWLLIEGSEDAGCPPVTAVPTGPQSGATNAPPATQPLPKGGCYVGVFRVSSNGRHVLRVTRQEDDPQAIESSDGRSVALANGRGIDTVDLKTQAVRHVLALPPSLSLGAFDWASDGRFMFTTIESSDGSTKPGLWITDTSGHHPRMLEPGSWASPRFVSRNRIIAVTSPSNRSLNWANNARIVGLVLNGNHVVPNSQWTVTLPVSYEPDFAPVSSP